MKRENILAIALALVFTLTADLCKAQTAQRPFQGQLFNEEYKVNMHINFYEQDITIPGQELFGQMAGYLRREETTYCWLVVSADIDGSRAKLVMSNDYGSEDLKAELTWTSDSTCVLKHISGATMKVPNNGKWQKLPSVLQLKRKK
jgi:hypothetical protein